MAFWGLVLKPGQPFTHTADDAKGRLHISVATLATLGTGTETKKSVVQCNVGNKSPVFLCSLFPEKFETCQLNLEFEEADDVVFSVIGPLNVHLTGYFYGSGRNHNLKDESESFGEDIADTETERSTPRSDDDYDGSDSFIDDSDPKLFPLSPLSDDGVTDKTLNRKKAKKGKGSRIRLRKYKLSESDNDSGTQQQMPENGTAVLALDSEDEDVNIKKAKKEKGNRRRLRKYKLSESDNDSGTQQQMLENGTAALALDSEDEDVLPISTLCKADHTTKSRHLEVGEKAIDENDDADLDSKSGNFEAEEKADIENGETKFETLQKDVKIKTDTVVSDESERGDDLQHQSVPSSKVEAETGATPKKKTKDQAKGENGLQADSSYDSIECMVIKNDETSRDELKAQNIGQDLPVGNEQNQKQANDKNSADLPPSSQVAPKKRKKRERELEEEEGRSFEADSSFSVNNEGKSQQVETKSDSIDKDLPMRIEQIEKEVNDDKTEEKEKKKKKKKRRIQEDMNMETDEKNRSVDSKPSQLRILPDGLEIEELEIGKPYGKVAELGKKISIRYIGKLKENGQEFDSNFDSTHPYKFRLGDEEIIDGLNIGVEGMRVGDKRRLVIPPSMGYGSEGDGLNVPPNSWLIYDVELVKVRSVK
ncbi:hypothetical protein LWI28_014918 [Acer negundo]|uniref:peptidylprolyl isomerase n=1 Tax=Acer negundo TaxID=4023 RepID=A0AAD5IW38_ACENE|nr:hypothetical protein LWI28_014918 [Acer negundo]KAK4843192.1 hypothetical protein QYF36_005178 [Acer negundo]